ncbi:MAG TPA: RagB/SusD family nutrient uptake outer membrane protein [Mucilaginibacter sp.]|jgi:hypothetical protein|nr:RagB/SusD family nutrient uptake outer membrane protein [Mucilaginibacter sp.]
MKNYFKFITLGSMAALTLTYSCKKLLDKQPVGVLGAAVLANKAGVDGLLIGAYSMLKGYTTSYGTAWETSIDNWVYGGIGSDDAYKGSNTTDQPDAAPIENHSVDASNPYLQQKYKFNYIAIQRANDAIREIPLVKDGSVPAAYGAQVVAEARFLRGVFHMELAKMFRNVAYVDESITYGAGNFNVPNSGPIWDKIEADFTAAMNTLPTTQSQKGRANKYAAEALLAKAYMFDHKYSTALPLLTDLITNGITSSGAKYALGAYEDNFNAATKNGPEAVFNVQMTVNDGSGGNNGNPGAILNFAAGPYTSCCGFYQPSLTLANAFKVDANGLPMFQRDANGVPASNVTALPNDHGYAVNATGQYTLGGAAAGVPFTPPANALDPRIDWTLGRYGIPYLDWGLCGGEQWSRGDVTPYNPIKNVFYHSAQASTSDSGEGWASNQDDANSYNLVRFADVILWRAECYVEANSLDLAQADVNTVRARMQNTAYWVHTYIDNANPSKGFTNIPAANYQIGLYGTAPGTSFAAMGQALAREAVYTERQLELGMEGHRFFDLQRYDGLYGGPAGASYMTKVENSHIKQDVAFLGGNPVLTGHTFTAGKNELYPIPQGEIDIEAGKLKQNPGY